MAIGFPLQSFGIWNRCFNKCGGYIGISWNGTFKTSFDSDKCEFECNIFKRNVCLVECGSNESGGNVIKS